MSERDFIKDNLLSQIEDLQRRVAELERFARVLDDGHVGVVNNLYDATDGAGLFDGEDDMVAPNGARIARGLYVGSTATEPVDGCVHIPGGSLIGTSLFNFADDTAKSFTPAQPFGVLLVFGRASPYMNISALVDFRVGANATTYLLLDGGAAAVTTGVLSGTTGTDGKFTISAHTDGKIYLENRRGVEIAIHYVVFGA